MWARHAADLMANEVSPGPASTSLVLSGHLGIHQSHASGLPEGVKKHFFSQGATVLFSVLTSQRASETDFGQRANEDKMGRALTVLLPLMIHSPIKLITSLASGGEFLQGISSFLLFSTAEHLTCCWDAFRCLGTVRAPWTVSVFCPMA